MDLSERMFIGLPNPFGICFTPALVSELGHAILAVLAARNGEADLLELAEAVWSRGGSVAKLVPTVERLVACGLVVEDSARSGGRFRLRADLRAEPPSVLRRLV